MARARALPLMCNRGGAFRAPTECQIPNAEFLIAKRAPPRKVIPMSRTTSDVTHRSAWPLLLLVGAGSFFASIEHAAASPETADPGAAVSAPATASEKPSYLNGIRETTLPNGLTVLTKEVHTAPVVFFSVYYRVGSVDEEVGQTGMSHLMEHMMFKGTKTRGPGVISGTLQNNGASFNASTWFDRTEYHETLASDRLDIAMQIESDRMVNSVYDEKQHQKEMTVVRSEYEAGENNPSVVLGKAVRLAAYQVHPYRWETIGFRSDIEHFTRDEMYAYYKNYYTPNNAVVVIVGDFDTPRALAMVNKYFGGIKPHAVQTHFLTPESAQEGERRVTVRRAGTLPDVQIVYHMPAFGDPDRYAIDVLETVLSAGRTSRFFSDLVQTGLASSADAGDFGLRFPDLLTLSASAQPGHTAPELEKALLTEVERIQNEPISQEELTRALNEAEAGYIFGKDSVDLQGWELGENAMRGDWRYGETYVENLRKVQAADVQRVARQYMVERNRTVGYFEPIVGGATGGGRSVSAGSGPMGAHTAGPAVQAPSAVGGPSYFTGPIGAANAEFPSTTDLSAGQNAVGSVQHLAHFVLDNGLTVIVQENHANPTISMSGALLSAGGVFDPQSKRGLARFTAGLLSRGTHSRSLLDIARTLEGVGASAGVSASEEYVSLQGRMLSRDAPTVLDVLSDELRNPSFPEAEIEKARTQTLSGLEREKEDTGALAQIAFTDALFPAGHPYASPTLDDQEAATRSFTRDDVASFYEGHYAPDRMILTIVGDITPSVALDLVKKYFGDWTRKGNTQPVMIADTPLPSGPVKPIVEYLPDKAQVNVLFGYPGQVKRSDPDFYRVIVLDTILGGGGGLSSRLALSVRDRLGLVYGIYASDSASLGAGPFEIEFGANPANADQAIAEMLQQVALLRDNGATKTEVQHAVDYLTGSYPVTLSTNGAVAGQLLIAQIYNLGLDYIQKRDSYYRAVTLDQVNEAARKYLNPGIGALVIVGTYTGQYAAKAPGGGQ